MENFDKIRLSFKELVSILFYSYGGPHSKCYDIKLLTMVSEVLYHRINGEYEQFDAANNLNKYLEQFSNYNENPKEWKGKK